MQNQSPSKNPFIGLARWGQAGGWRWYVAALGAGWLSFVRTPPLSSRASASFVHVLLGGALLIAVLFVIGPVLSMLQPAFRALGQLDGWQLAFIAVVLLNVWRYAKGRKILKALTSSQAVTSVVAP